MFLLIALVGVLDMPAMFWPGDPWIWREETRSILNHGTLAVDPSLVPFAGEPGQTLILNQTNHQFYAKYGVMNSLMSLPPMWVDRVFFHGDPKPMIEPHVVVFNLWNIFLSLLLAWMLLKIAGLYTARDVTRVIFVLCCFYGTYLWYYLRAQSSEIYQALFFAMAFYLLVTFLRKLDTRVWLWRVDLMWLLIGMLVLSRILYLLLLILVPVFIALAIMRLPREKRAKVIVDLLPHLIVPPLAIVLVLGWINQVKFGSPFATGYHIWKPEQHQWTGSFWAGLKGFLFWRRFSIFLYFPLLPFALLMMGRFVKRFPIDAAIAITIPAAFILFLAKTPSWAGEWTYGPRYVLFALPILCLPFVLLVDWLIDHARSFIARGLIVIIGISLLYSAYLQFRVNQLNFFAYYQLRQGLEPDWPAPVADYFENHHVGTITDDLLRHKHDPDSLWWFSELKRAWPSQRVEQQRKRILRIASDTNHYWLTGQKTFNND